jgi:carbon-monoxide dehydrogenase large subunit
MSKYGIGQPVLRFEDPRLLRGQGRFINDVNLPGQAHAVFVRSPHAHAKIRAIDVEAAKEAPGVVAVLTGHDVKADGLGMPKANMPRKRPDGKPMYAPQRPPLVTDRVRYVGDPVVMVVADTLAEAKDAAELVNIDYEALPSVTATEDTVKAGAPAVWDDCPDNISNNVERGNKAATDEAIKSAAKVIKRRYVITRVHAQYMEPRGTLGVYDQGEDRLTLYADVQYPHRVRNMLAQNVFKVPESKMRVVAQDVGGGFGTKGWQYVEHRLTLWAARKLLRPVKWTCERSEAVMADEHGRDNIGEIELALDKDNKFVALRLNMLANIGAYVGSDRNLLSPFGMIGTVLGVYLIPKAYINVIGVLSNTNPTAPYRGAHLSDRAVDRRCGARARCRPDRVAPQEHAAGIGIAVSEPGRTVLRLRRVREEHGHGAEAGRRRRLQGACRGLEETRQAARARYRQCHRAGRRHGAAGICRDPVQSQRHGGASDGHQGPGAGPRDHVQADPA